MSRKMIGTWYISNVGVMNILVVTELKNFFNVRLLTVIYKLTYLLR